MAENQDSDQEKTEEASQHRIDEARKKGDVASSKELVSILVLAGAILTLTLSIVFIYETLEEYVLWLYKLDIAYAYTKPAVKTIIYKTVKTGFYCTAPIALTAACIGIIANVAQVGILYAPEVLTLKFDRVNPIAGVKRLFSLKSLVEAIKGVFKFAIILGIVYLFFRNDFDSYSGFLHMTYENGFMYGKDLLVKLAISILIGLLVVAIGDFGYQKFSYKKKLMMTKDEAKREHKEQEGSPELKQRIKSVQREMASKRMMGEIPSADVVVTNPTHISVVLKYDPETMVSPMVVAKGADNLALRIREIAKDNDIPIVENVPLARTLYKTVKIEEPVPRSVYKTVAEVLSFVYKLKQKKKALS